MNDVSKISVKDLNVSFGDTQALKNVSLEIKSNEVLTIIGPANSGKSSLLLSINRMIDRIENVSLNGSILIDGCNVYAGQNVENLRRRVGMVFALPISLPMSIRDNVLFGIRMLRHVARHDGDVLVEKTLRAAFLWDEVKDRLNSHAFNLSGGQQQRLCIARTLAVGPEIILFDEPCSGLDPISTGKVEEAIRLLAHEQTIVLVTNNTKQAARVGDRTAFLLMGELVEIDETHKIFTSPANSRTEEYVTGRFG